MSRSWVIGSLVLAFGGVATLAAAPPDDKPSASTQPKPDAPAAKAPAPESSAPGSAATGSSTQSPTASGSATTGAKASGSTAPGSATGAAASGSGATTEPKASAGASGNVNAQGSANQPTGANTQGNVNAQGNVAQPGATGAQGSANVQTGAAAGQQSGSANTTGQAGASGRVNTTQPSATGQTGAAGQANVNTQTGTQAGTQPGTQAGVQAGTQAGAQTNVNAQTNLNAQANQTNIAANFAQAVGLGFTQGRNDLTISTIQPGSPFASIGLVPGDQIVSIAGQTFASPFAFQQYLYSVPVGQRVPVIVTRNGVQQTLYWTPTQAFVQSLPPLAPAPAIAHGGPIFASLTYVPGRPLGIQMDGRVQDATIVSAVTPGSPADQAGVMRGDRITAINEQPVGGPPDFLNKLGQLPPQAPLKLSLARSQEVNVGVSAPVPVTAGRPIVPDPTPLPAPAVGPSGNPAGPGPRTIPVPTPDDLNPQRGGPVRRALRP